MKNNLKTDQYIYKWDIRVPYAHVDKMGFVYYANYLIYFEMARSEQLRERGFLYTDMENKGIILPILESHLNYYKPAHYDDMITVLSQPYITGKLKLHINYQVKREDEILVTGHTTQVALGENGKIITPTIEMLKICEI